MFLDKFKRLLLLSGLCFISINLFSFDQENSKKSAIRPFSEFLKPEDKLENKEFFSQEKLKKHDSIVALPVAVVIQEKLKKASDFIIAQSQDKIRDVINSAVYYNLLKKIQNFTQFILPPQQPLLLTLGVEETTESLQQDEDMLHSPLYFKTTESRDESGNRTVVHEHTFETSGGTVEYKVGTFHEAYDTIDRPVQTRVEINYIQNERDLSSNSSSNDRSDRSDFNDHIKDAAMSRELESGKQNNSSSHNLGGDYPEKQRSAVYTWCKSKKEKWIGPSKKTRESQKSQQKEKDRSSQQEKERSLREHEFPSNEMNSVKNETGVSTQSQEKVDNSLSNIDDVKIDPNLKFNPYNSRPNNPRPTGNSSNYNSDDDDDEDDFDDHARQAEDKLIASHGYTFQPTETAQAQLTNAEKALQQAQRNYDDLSVLAYDYWMTRKNSELYKQLQQAKENKLNAEKNIQEEQDAWREKSLQEIEEKERTRVEQEKADQVKAEQERQEKLRQQVESLIAYGYKFQLSGKIDQQLQHAEIEFAQAQNRSLLEYWFTNKYRNEQMWKEKIKQLKEQAVQEKKAWEKQSLQEIEQNLQRVQQQVQSKFDEIKTEIVQRLREQAQAQKDIEQAQLDDFKKQNEAKCEPETDEQRAQRQAQEEALKGARDGFEAAKEEKMIQDQAAKDTYEKIKDFIAAALALGDKFYNGAHIPLDSPTYSQQPTSTSSTSSSENKEENLKEKQLFEAQYAWKRANNVQQADAQEKSMIYKMLDTIALTENQMAVEYAQAALEAWKQAQQAESVQQHDYYLDKFNNYYQKSQSTSSDTSRAQQNYQIQQHDIDRLATDYATKLQVYKQNDSVPTSSIDQAYLQRLEKRAQALQESQEQVRNQSFVHQDYKITPQAYGYMMANNMNYAAFNGGFAATSFQHCLTQELVGIIEFSAQTESRYGSDAMISQLARYNCQLAVGAQQLNQQAQIDQAAAVTDLTHFFEMYGRAMLDDELESKAFADLAGGVYQGTVQALQKWGHFAEKLYTEPKKTLGDIAHDYYQVGEQLYKLAGLLTEFTPIAQLDDMMKDMQDSLDTFKQGNCYNLGKSRMQQRLERNSQLAQQGLSATLESAQAIIGDIMQKSAKENIANVTEGAINYVITGKIAESLLHACQIIGNQALSIAGEINNKIPPHLYNSSINFTTSSSGHVAAFAEQTSENIGGVVAAAGNQLTDPSSFFKQAVQAKNGFNKNKNESAKDKEKAKEAAPTQSYTYEHGKYRPSAKHHKNSPPEIGKPPRDGQAALDSSFEVEGPTTQRVAVQDGKVVILKYEENGIYHGYIVEDLNSLKTNVKDPLVKNGFMKDTASKSLIRK